MQSFIKLGPKGVMPERAHPTDVGYDLTLVEKRNVPWNNGEVEVYGTDVYLQPCDPSLYFEVVPRSSIVKTSYMLANSVGIIDPSYTGEILVVLRKVGNGPDLKLPARVAQLIPRKRYDVEFIQDDLEKTKRGTGGFGSTN